VSRAGGASPSPAGSASRGATSRGAVHFEIGRIGLHGFSPAHRARFIASLHASLSELASAADWSLSEPRQLARVSVADMRPGASPEDAAALVTARVRAAIVPTSERAAIAPTSEPGALR
jgi:predicted mannosyl-3-phosphoglycerate phosphatase (HAD superfamily)